MRSVYSLGVAVFIAACSSSSTPPGGSCATRASAELSALQAAIETAETNIERGFGIERQLVAGSSQVEEVQVAINVAKERQKLADLQERLGPVQAQTNAAAAQCGS